MKPPNDHESLDLTIASASGEGLFALYANHADITLAPHHFDVLFALWSFPRQQPTTPEEAVVIPEPVARIIIPAGAIPELIDQLQEALRAHKAVEAAVDTNMGE